LTVGSQVKGCFSAVKSIEASLAQLHEKSQSKEAKQAFQDVELIISEVKKDLEKQVINLAKEEPQYK
jgi:Protein of unknown function (DUF1657)